MNDAAKKWVAALRSGNYSQCAGKLTNGEGYCCLGVAEKVLNPAGDWGHKVHLTEATRIKLGLQSLDGGFDVSGWHNFLTTLNDRGDSFSEIADIIESEPEGLFMEGKQ